MQLNAWPVWGLYRNYIQRISSWIHVKSTRNDTIINAPKTVLVAQYTFWWIPLKVHSQELLSEQIDCHIWNLHGFFTQRTNFHTSRARCSWKQAIIMNHSKNEILGETPLDMTWIDGFPLSDNIFSIWYNLNLDISPDELNTKPGDFLWITYCQVVQVHPTMNKFCLYACLLFWVCVRFQCENWEINLSASSGF